MAPETKKKYFENRRIYARGSYLFFAPLEHLVAYYKKVEQIRTFFDSRGRKPRCCGVFRKMARKLKKMVPRKWYDFPQEEKNGTISPKIGKWYVFRKMVPRKKTKKNGTSPKEICCVRCPPRRENPPEKHTTQQSIFTKPRCLCVLGEN